MGMVVNMVIILNGVEMMEMVVVLETMVMAMMGS